MTGYLLSARAISKSFGTVRAVNSVSLDLVAGSTLVVRGASGSGKTTLLRLLAGLELPDEGEIWIEGSPGGSLPPYRRGMGFVFQSPALWPHLTVAGNILFGMAGRPRREARQRLGELLERTGLTGLEKRYPDQLSGGQARRVALARALAPRPRCLLMDEPLTNLDGELKEKMLALIKEETAFAGSSLIYVTHDDAEAYQLGIRVVVMAEGSLLDQQ
jgi:ABC-type Fe3+/spermidine/putrescine transport system ATPase subunit